MGLLEQFFRLREPAWSGRVVTLGALAARCPASPETKGTAAPAVPSVSQNGAAKVEQPAAERSPPAAPPLSEDHGSESSRPARRKTGEASVIAPNLRTEPLPEIPKNREYPPTVFHAASAIRSVQPAELSMSGAQNRGDERDGASRAACPAEPGEGEKQVPIPEVESTAECEAMPASVATAADPVADAVVGQVTRDEISTAEPFPSQAGGNALALPPLPPPRESSRPARRGGPCLEDPTLPPLQLRAQVSEQTAEARPLVLGEVPAVLLSSTPAELRQITPPPVGIAPVQRPSLVTSEDVDETKLAMPEASAAESAPDPALEITRLEALAKPGVDVAGLLAQIRALPGVAEARVISTSTDHATH